MNYGFTDKKCLKKQIKKVCDALGYGANGTADKLIYETMLAETGAGEIKDRSEYAGMGICQFDEIGFEDTKRRSVRRFDIVSSKLGINLFKVEWEHLRYNPFLSIIFCRLKYKLIPEEIPVNRFMRAKYWKKYYNTKAGKGTVEHYMSASRS